MKKIFLLIVLTLVTIGAFGQTKTNDSAKNAPVTTTTAFKVKYDYVFKLNTDGSYTTLTDKPFHILLCQFLLRV